MQWIESSKEQHLYEIYFSFVGKNAKDFTVTFDHFNAHLLIKSINFFHLSSSVMFARIKLHVLYYAFH